MKAFLDDVRDAPNEEWTVFRNVHALMNECIFGDRAITHISLDHDLGEGEKTGYDFLNWLEGRVASGWIKKFHTIYPLPVLTVHSANPVGIKNMEAAIASIHRLMDKLEDE